MQLGNIILILDDIVETDHMMFWCEHCRFQQQQRSLQQPFREEDDLAPSPRKELVTIQFGSLEPVVLSLMVLVAIVDG